MKAYRCGSHSSAARQRNRGPPPTTDSVTNSTASDGESVSEMEQEVESPLTKKRRMQNDRRLRQQRRKQVNKATKERVNQGLREEGALGISPKVRRDSVMQWDIDVKTPQATLRQPVTFNMDDQEDDVHAAMEQLVKNLPSKPITRDISALEAVFSQFVFLTFVSTGKDPERHSWSDTTKKAARIIMNASQEGVKGVHVDVQWLCNHLAQYF